MKTFRLRRLNLFMAGLFVLASLIYVTFKWTKYYFGRHLDVEAIFFTLSLPVDGFDRAILFSYLKLMALALPAMLVLAVGYYRLLRRCSGGVNGVGVKNHPRSKCCYILLLIVGLSYFLGSVCYLEHRKRLLSFLLMPREQSSMFEERYRQTGPVELTLGRRNLVLLILESVEDTFNDETIFGEKLMPGLAKLRAENLSFHGGRETRGADWTIGAMTAYTLGLPLAFARESSLGNYFGESSSTFLPGAASIFEILEGHGYKIAFF